MSILRLIAVFCAILAGTSAPALDGQAVDRLIAADVVFLGEVHDNPAHHVRQAAIVEEMAPRAVVFEMLTPDQARQITAPLRGDPAALADILDWDRSGWPDFSLYYPIIAAAPAARLYGAGVTREAARAAIDTGVAESFGPDAAEFGLSTPLPEAEQALREAKQMQAHCDALPAEMLPGMVALQRLRDAVLAREALRAFDETGGPVVVITGNGHARMDWGAPAYLRRARADLRITSLGQGESGAEIDGAFSIVFEDPPVARDDPCAVFADREQ